MRLTAWFWAIIAAWFWVFVEAGGEGVVLPAVAPLDIHHIERTIGGVEILGKVNRLRPECNFRAVRWYLGERTQKNVPLRHEFREAPKIRHDGETLFGPWFVQLPPNVSLTGTHADAFHKCRLFGVRLPWTTRSRLW